MSELLEIKPMTGEDYDCHWNYTDFNNKTILDIGADYGSTAYWFLKRGAKKVVAVEADDGHFKTLELNVGSGLLGETESIHLCVCQPSDYNILIATYKPDIVKIDIEGHERPLLEADKEIVKSVPEYLIETHTDAIFCNLATMFRELGYKVEFATHTDTIDTFGIKTSVDVLYAYRK